LGNKCFLVLRKSWEIPWCLGHSLEYSFYSISTVKNPEMSDIAVELRNVG